VERPGYSPGKNTGRYVEKIKEYKERLDDTAEQYLDFLEDNSPFSD
jgi:hypothetical protein